MSGAFELILILHLGTAEQETGLAKRTVVSGGVQCVFAKDPQLYRDVDGNVVNTASRSCELLWKLMHNYINPGQLCLDLFQGSGSVMEVCLRAGWGCLGIEIDKVQVTAAVLRRACVLSLMSQEYGDDDDEYARDPTEFDFLDYTRVRNYVVTPTSEAAPLQQEEEDASSSQKKKPVLPHTEEEPAPASSSSSSSSLSSSSSSSSNASSSAMNVIPTPSEPHKPTVDQTLKTSTSIPVKIPAAPNPNVTTRQAAKASSEVPMSAPKNRGSKVADVALVDGVDTS
jgi:hypothetical protein